MEADNADNNPKGRVIYNEAEHKGADDTGLYFMTLPAHWFHR